jgi:integrase
MGTVFKKTFTKPLPAGAELFTREGQQFARWKDAKGKARKALVTSSKDGQARILIEAKTYTAKYRDGGRIVREVSTGCRDEQAARSVLADLERRSELVKAGVMTPKEDQIADHQGIALAEHFDAYEASLRSKGVTDGHRKETRCCLDRLAAECLFRRLLDLKRGPLEKWLTQESAKGMSARTRNAYQGAAVSFCNWCIECDRLAVNPFDGMPKANENADRKRVHRAMDEAELVQLLDVTRGRPILEAMTVRKGNRKGEAYAKLRDETKANLERLGWERALTYKTMILTRLRKGELASMTVGRIHLDADLPYLDLDAADEKNRQGSTIMLRDDLADDPRQWLAAELVRLQAEAREQGGPIPARLQMDMPLFTVPKGLLRILNRDLKAAGIAKVDERGRTLDVHALRTTFGTLLSKGGVAPRTAQAAMRHASLDMTMQVYTDPKLLDVRGALDSLPMLPLNAGQSDIAESARATGTNGLRQCSLAPTLAPTSDKRVQKPSSAVKTAGVTLGMNGRGGVDVTSEKDKRREPLTRAVNGSRMSGRLDSNQRPPEPHSGALAKLRHAPMCGNYSRSPAALQDPFPLRASQRLCGF